MLDINFIRENAELVKQNTKDRLSPADIDRLLTVDEEWRQAQTEIQELRTRRNKTSKTKPTAEEISEMKALGDEIAQRENSLLELETGRRSLLLAVPNLTHPDVKRSDDEADNPVIETVGELPAFDFEAKDHLELAETLDLLSRS